jgi:hypothetical protein
MWAHRISVLRRRICCLGASARCGAAVTAGPVFRWARLTAGTTRSGLCEGRHLRAASVLGPVLVSAATTVFAAEVWRLRPAMVVRAAAAVRRSRRTLLVVAVGDAADVDERRWLRGLLSSLVECRRLAWTCASCSVVVWHAANKHRCAPGMAWWHYRLLRAVFLLAEVCRRCRGGSSNMIFLYIYCFSFFKNK